MLDNYAKQKYDVASTMVDEINGEDIRVMLLQVTIETSKAILLKGLDSQNEKVLLYDSKKLKRLSESLLFKIVFDKRLTRPQIESAALVCAQAYEVLCPDFDEKHVDLFDYQYLNRLISALLYFVAGYDSSSTNVVSELSKNLVPHKSDNIHFLVLDKFVHFVLQDMKEVSHGLLETDYAFDVDTFEDLYKLCEQTALVSISNCLTKMARELCEPHEFWSGEIKEELINVYQSCREYGDQTLALLAALLMLVEDAIKVRAISILSSPEDCTQDIWFEHMQRYIDEDKFLIWPPHRDALDKKLLAPNTNNIISIPTGTGKSMIAEHKIIASLQRGKLIIYLAPTLALCRQIVENMRRLLSAQRGAKKAALFTDDWEMFESSELIEDTILVMTPEKCVSLISNNSSLVSECILCVVDEFHNIHDNSRGPLLDALLSKVSVLAPRVSFLLLSALAEDKYNKLPTWLDALNKRGHNTTSLKWRPARTLRGFIAHPYDEYVAAKESAASSGKKSFTTTLSGKIYFCIQDVWADESRSAYPLAIPLNFKVRFKEKVSRDGELYWGTDGYANDISRQLGNWLASRGMPVIIFSQATRHLLDEIDKHRKIGEYPQNLNERTLAYLEFAKEELGFESELLDGLKKGVGIHTQAVIEFEQLAVEEFFKQSSQGVLCATGTLAQGLNLPASAVVVNTTEQYQDETSKPLSKSEVINMLGRAGRPGLGLQSLGIIVPQKIATFRDRKFRLRDEYSSYLERIDGVIPLKSGLSQTFNDILSKEINEIGVDDDFTTLTNVLNSENREARHQLVKKTLASQFFVEDDIHYVLKKWDTWLSKTESDQEKMILLTASIKSSNPISVLEKINGTVDWDGLNNALQEIQSTKEWIDWYLKESSKLGTEFLGTKVHDLFQTISFYEGFVSGWVSGRTIKRLAHLMYETKIAKKPPEDKKRSSQTSIAKTIKIVQEGVRNISHLSSAYVMLIEQVVQYKYGQDFILPETLKKMPACLRYGVNDTNALIFRRRGLPRSIALQLSSVFPASGSIEPMIQNWKRSGKIEELELEAKIERAIIELV